MELMEFKDPKCIPDIIHSYPLTIRENAVPIVIDNGSYICRAGWSVYEAPLLQFKNLIAKPRKERLKKDTSENSQIPQLQIGNDIVNIEAVRFQLKTQFDRNVVTHFEAQEHLFDYTFSHLGIDTDNSVNHPLVLTEAFLNPNTSRQLMSELLFECYEIPGLSYGVDSLFSYHYAQVKPLENALIVNLGYQTCHVIPIINNQTIFENTRRLNIGGWNVVTFLHRILQLKYPAHATAITLSRAEELLHSICAVSPDYTEELTKWTNHEYYEKNIKRIQLPYSIITNNALTLEQQKERKRELARRLTEINARKREERLAEDQDKLKQFLELQEIIDFGAEKEEVDQILSEYELKSVQDLQKTVANLNARIEKTKQKILASTNIDDIEEPPIKQAKNSKMVFENDSALHSFLDNVKKMRQDIINKKLTRKQRKQDIFKRRTAAGQERMRIISQLARKEKGNDDFGLRDEDWDIYKTISKDGGDSDSEAENEKLLELEEVIRAHEPSQFEEGVNVDEMHQLHVGIERFRAPELIFKPYMSGSVEAGLSEIIGYVLSLFNEEDQLKLAANVIVTGGLGSLKGFKERILNDLISIRPFKSEVNVNIMENCSLTAWYGAKEFAMRGDYTKNLLTKSMYEECGPEYFKTHKASNRYYPTPKEITVDVDC
ncbi:actin-related protein 5 [Diorhabda sublineata]|uniref:actin-related protein 5 n=1 Tax=Diorhabda sublineata TaxID=1163346 RepID=UPI0024E0D35F|nr:actin-related protein 5 [Diorhabda sublineata]